MIPHAIQVMVWSLTTAWFVIYWIVGGVVFSLVAASRALKIKKARFSCLFTLVCASTAWGAAWLSTRLSLRVHPICTLRANGFFDSILNGLNCSAREIWISGLLGFLVLLALSLIILVLSSESQPSKLETRI